MLTNKRSSEVIVTIQEYRVGIRHARINEINGRQSAAIVKLTVQFEFIISVTISLLIHLYHPEQKSDSVDTLAV